MSRFCSFSSLSLCSFWSLRTCSCRTLHSVINKKEPFQGFFRARDPPFSFLSFYLINDSSLITFNFSWRRFIAFFFFPKNEVLLISAPVLVKFLALCHQSLLYFFHCLDCFFKGLIFFCSSPKRRSSLFKSIVLFIFCCFVFTVSRSLKHHETIILWNTNRYHSLVQHEWRMHTQNLPLFRRSSSIFSMRMCSPRILHNTLFASSEPSIFRVGLRLDMMEMTGEQNNALCLVLSWRYLAMHLHLKQEPIHIFPQSYSQNRFVFLWYIQSSRRVPRTSERLRTSFVFVEKPTLSRCIRNKVDTSRLKSVLFFL